MSELIIRNDNRATIRWKLLTSASALALTAYASSTALAKADDAVRPTLWIEVGGDASMVSGEGKPFVAPFMINNSTSPVFSPVSPLGVQKPPPYSFGGEVALSYQPENTDWVFSASIRYGRSSSTRNAHQQTKGLPVPTTSFFYQFFASYYHSYFHTLTEVESFAHYQTHHSEKHAVLDFQAGKDVGLGMFGRDATSVLSAGVRMVQFDSSATAQIWARPNASVTFSSFLPKYYFHWRDFHLSGSAVRGFHGLGPTLSWNGSVPIAGNLNDGELALDWGVNAALLFGKQTAKVQHSTSSYHITHIYYHKVPDPQDRSRSVTVPNVGGSLGISYQFVDAKLNLGYRYDTFFGAMDTGIDAAHKADMTFKGPYASISIGIGD